jgi:hypothetical protein
VFHHPALRNPSLGVDIKDDIATARLEQLEGMLEYCLPVWHHAEAQGDEDRLKSDVSIGGLTQARLFEGARIVMD